MNISGGPNESNAGSDGEHRYLGFAEKPFIYKRNGEGIRDERLVPLILEKDSSKT